MKITKEYLRTIIKEELQSISMSTSTTSPNTKTSGPVGDSSDLLKLNTDEKNAYNSIMSFINGKKSANAPVNLGDITNLSAYKNASSNVKNAINKELTKR